MIGGIRVLVGTFASEPFVIGLFDLLRATAEFQPIEFVDSIELDEIVRDGQPSILIVEGSDPHLYRVMLERAEHVALVMLDTNRASAIVQLSNPSWGHLYHVLRTVAEQLASGAPVDSRITVVDPPASDPSAPGHRIPDGRDLGRIVSWLNLSLARPLLALASNQASSGIPGWSVAPREALNLLGHDDQLTAEGLAVRYQAADAALIASRQGMPPSLTQLAERLALPNDELRLLLLILAPEIDGRYATAIGVLQDDLTRRRPGLTLLSILLDHPGPAWDLSRHLERVGSIQSAGLVEPEAGGSGTGVEVGYAPTRALLDFLAAGPGELPHGTLGAHLVTSGPADRLGAAESAVAVRLEEVLVGISPPPLLHLPDNDADAWFTRIATAAGYRVLQVDLGLIDRDRPAAATVTDWCRLGHLHDAGLFVAGLDSVLEPERHRVERALAAATDRLPFVAVAGTLTGRHLGPTPIVRLSGPNPGPSEQASAWTEQASTLGVTLQPDEARRLTAMGPTSQADRHTALTLFAGSLPAVESLTGREPAPIGVAGLQRVLRDLRRQSLPPVIRRIEAVYGWDDLVLADQAKDVLRMIPEHMIHAGRVLDDWSYARRLPYGQGVAALFSGPSGTGKTMAAQVIASALGVDLFQVDLSKVVSKYIGETEKNLEQVFDLAERDGAVLLFDEADALFGKRTEVRDSHDRHANVEVAYLLQRMEAFTGLAVLTTNLKQNIDGAFLRRLRFAVEFPMPSSAEREAIWRRSFPPAAPLDPDLDVVFLARRLPLTGGSIQQIAIHAAFAAAATGRDAIGMAEVVEASRRELVKVGLLNAEKALDDLAA